MSDETANEKRSQDDLVVTPGGPRAPESVHRVGPGEAVRMDEVGNPVIVPRQPADLGRLEEMVPTPGGYRHRSLVHRIEHGNVLDCRDGHHRQLDPAGRMVADYGVIPMRPGGDPLISASVQVPTERTAASSYLYPGHVTRIQVAGFDAGVQCSLKATWQVPCAPDRASGQLIYLFPALQNTAWIFQPVLQWGYSGAGGGDYWAVASWYADGLTGPAFHTDAVRVEVGDTLVGSIFASSDPLAPAPWYLEGTCSFDGINRTSLVIHNIPPFNSAIVDLEAYGITKCSDYPGADKIHFWNIALEVGGGNGGLSWKAVDQVTDCGQHAEIDKNSMSHGEVHLWCRSPRRFAWGTEVGVVSRSKDKMDVFAVDSYGHVDHASWDPNSGWQGWWRVACGLLGGQGAPMVRAPVSAVSRSTDKIDLFGVDPDGHVITAAYEPDDGWQGWWQVVPNLELRAGVPVGAVSRSTDKLDIFVAGNDGQIWTAAWEPDIAGWRGWWQIGDLNPGVEPGTPVSAVSRAKDKLDIFVPAKDEQVWTASWAPDSGGWHGWWQLPPVSLFQAGVPVTAVSRSKDKLDVFTVDSQFNEVWTAAWEPDIPGWRGWWEVLPKG